jgi:arylsulfatase A
MHILKKNIVWLGLLVGLVGVGCSPAPTSPNIIIIYADDLGYSDVGLYGGDIPTPNIDRIGKEGIQFTDFYVAGPVCTPSRYGLLTGRYPVRSEDELLTALMPFDKKQLQNTEKILPAYLKEKNYQTALIGKWHLGKSESALPTHHGFDLFTGFTGGCIDFFDHVYGSVQDDWYVDGTLKKETGYSTDLITTHAINFLTKVKANNKPFFLYLPYNAPHFGKTNPDSIPAHTVVLKEDLYEGHPIANTLQAPEAYYKRFEHIEDPYRKAYAAMVSSLDDNIGKLYTYLEKNNLIDNTIIWFISDNGGYAESYFGHARNGKFRGEKGTLYEGGIRVPSLLSWKGKIQPNQTRSSIVGNIDILPTLATLIGFEDNLSPIVDGKNIQDVLFENHDIERELFWKYKNQLAYRKGEWKIVGDNELYNLNEDPSETTNVSHLHTELHESLKNRALAIAASAEKIR